jgi:Immunoglobulin I-set domain
MAADGLEEVDALIGETQRFECQVIGYPTPTIRWYKDEIDITNSVRYNIDYSRDDGVTTLIIRNVSLADEGLYQCRAENSEGVATTTAYLVVRGHYNLPISIPSLAFCLLRDCLMAY